MDKNFQQKIKTSTHGVPVVQSCIKVDGGIKIVSIQTWMVCTWKENIRHTALESNGMDGKGFITHWKERQWWFEENRTLNINK